MFAQKFLVLVVWRGVGKDEEEHGKGAGKISTTKAKMQATIDGIHAQENNDKDRAKKMKAGVIWEDADFRTIGLDPNVLLLDESPDDEVTRRKTCVFWAWIEEGEDEAVGPKGSPIVEQKILSSMAD